MQAFPPPMHTPPPLSPASLAQYRQIFSRAAALLASSTDFFSTLEHTVAACLPGLGDFGFFDVVHGDTVRRTARAHLADDIEALLKPTQWARSEREDLNLCALSSGRAALHPDIDDAWYRRVAANEGHLALLRALAFRSMITVPMRYGDELIGALTLFMGRSGRRHTDEDLTLAAELASLAAPVVVNARLLEQHRRSEAERAALLAAERSARATAEAARRRLELLSMAGTMLSQSLESQVTLEAIASIVVPSIADWCRIDLVDAHGELQRAITHHRDPQTSQFGAELVEPVASPAGTPGTMAWVVATGRSHLASFETPADIDRIPDPQMRDFARAVRLRAYFVVPLKARGRTIGALAALQADSGRGFGDDDCSLIAVLAQRAALALDNARLYAQAEAARQDAEAARRQAETANRAKDEFLAMLGHELRNPLAPIVTTLHLMARRDNHAFVAERNVLERQVMHLSRLVDDLLDVSRIARGKITLEHAWVDMRDVVSRSLEQVAPALASRRRAIELELPDEPAPVLGDATRLGQVVCNLLSNAAKFTPPDGRIALRLETPAQQVRLCVEDEGMGIAPELLPSIFELFVQGRQSLDRRSGGLGLGLAIVQTIVRLHGGQVRAKSEGLGFGSRFVVELPRAGEREAQP